MIDEINKCSPYTEMAISQRMALKLAVTDSAENHIISRGKLSILLICFVKVEFFFNVGSAEGRSTCIINVIYVLNISKFFVASVLSEGPKGSIGVQAVASVMTVVNRTLGVKGWAGDMDESDQD